MFTTICQNTKDVNAGRKHNSHLFFFFFFCKQNITILTYIVQSTHLELVLDFMPLRINYKFRNVKSKMMPPKFALNFLHIQDFKPLDIRWELLRYGWPDQSIEKSHSPSSLIYIIPADGVFFFFFFLQLQLLVLFHYPYVFWKFILILFFV